MEIIYSISTLCQINNSDANYAKINYLMQNNLNYFKSDYFLIGSASITYEKTVSIIPRTRVPLFSSSVLFLDDKELSVRYTRLSEETVSNMLQHLAT